MILLRVWDRQHNRGGPVISLSRRRAPDVHKSTADAAESQVGRVRVGVGVRQGPPRGTPGETGGAALLHRQLWLCCYGEEEAAAPFLAGGLWEEVEWWLLANS